MQISTLQTAYMIEKIQHLILSIEKKLFSHVGVINVVVTSPCKSLNINCKMMYESSKMLNIAINKNHTGTAFRICSQNYTNLIQK